MFPISLIPPTAALQTHLPKKSIYLNFITPAYFYTGANLSHNRRVCTAESPQARMSSLPSPPAKRNNRLFSAVAVLLAVLSILIAVYLVLFACNGFAPEMTESEIRESIKEFKAQSSKLEADKQALEAELSALAPPSPLLVQNLVHSNNEKLQVHNDLIRVLKATLLKALPSGRNVVKQLHGKYQ